MQASVLFLMEKPGPMTDGSATTRRKGSGFISRDNDDPAAEAVFRFMETAGIDRRLTLIWNIVPWWNGTRTTKPEELVAGRDRLVRLLDLLANFRAVVAVGGRAERARGLIEARTLPFLSSPHPSPINRAARPDLWWAIPAR
nr:uracil-DNA glycosylase [Paracoccus sp. PAR01]